ncbi:MAG: FKBP-type peptidyl-prolyl cis-trans isomerase [uncultured bacterium]|nr:MAG: FKBP-type peptidyl-prolyl cis-trans isomerase [uncultured bacterium]
MNHSLLRALHRFEGLRDQMLPGLGQDLDQHPFRNQVPLDEHPGKVIFHLRGGREADLYFLEPDIDKELEHLEFFVETHRLDESLVAVAQINAAPDRSFFYGFSRPGAVRQKHLRIGTIFSHQLRIHFFSLLYDPD